MPCCFRMADASRLECSSDRAAALEYAEVSCRSLVEIENLLRVSLMLQLRGNAIPAGRCRPIPSGDDPLGECHES
jgi:hypothetical protein